ncbi:pseudouridine synthase [Gilvimarinus polysaccharolyticus]|uniref:pseudouridine synthase n=1 Tax=Gilvimarinus polysaccharolyticus TaxID=863921 RepID=UPI000A636B6C|nr:pseudouridine synthase [Gilvimarinus polysaccharolyticus]
MSTPTNAPPKQPELSILYRDEHLIAINKPSGLLVHRSPIDRHETRFAIQLLRDQIGQRVYPVHRLDKPTSGILLFALNSDTARAVNESWQAGNVSKHYVALVRGYFDTPCLVDHPLRYQPDKHGDAPGSSQPLQSAQTMFNPLARIELPEAVDRYPTSRYSLVHCRPITGRKHQLRRHLKHLHHPIIGDPKYGKSVHNHFFADRFGANRLLLAATELQLRHPITDAPLIISAPISGRFATTINALNWHTSLPSNWREANNATG